MYREVAHWASQMWKRVEYFMDLPVTVAIQPEDTSQEQQLCLKAVLITQSCRSAVHKRTCWMCVGGGSQRSGRGWYG
jgi:uncharacterized Fe-S cluster-containing MiaB family protein